MSTSIRSRWGAANAAIEAGSVRSRPAARVPATTVAPAARSASAVASPRPAWPPVMRTVRFGGYTHVKFGIVHRGRCFIGEQALAAGDCYVLSSGEPYVLSADPALTPEDGDARWRRAGRDGALRIGADPEGTWSVEALAADAHLSRSAFATRFTRLVGISPAAYGKRWRIHRAASDLREPGATVGAVGRRYGYASHSSFSHAYKDVMGVAPSRAAA